MIKPVVEKIILGIDPGTNVMGYGVIKVEGTKPSIVTMGVIDMRKESDMYLKLGHIFQRVNGIIDSYLPDELAIEAPFFGKNVQSMLKLGRAQGVAIAAALARDIPYEEYEPSVIKQTVTGNGNASKEQVGDILRSILHFEEHPHYLDATDALAVAYTCHMQLTNPLGDLRAQLSPHKKQRKSAKKQWADFVNQNPDIVQ